MTTVSFPACLTASAVETPSLQVMGLLRHGVPLSLLMDLADPAGPDSAAIARSERAAPVAPAPRSTPPPAASVA